MPKFAVNLSILFTESPFLERFGRAAQLGFDSVEFFYPYDCSPSELNGILAANKLNVALFNVHAGDMPGGDRGFASDPSRRDWWRRQVEEALEWSHRLNCTQVNVLTGKRIPQMAEAAQWECLEENLRWALPPAESAGVAINIEGLNTVESPGYLLGRSSQAFDLIRKIGNPNLRFQYDVYHMQVMEGNIINTIKANLDLIGHIQIADVPGRHEPGTGEINYPNVFAALDEMGYTGYVSCEYKPSGRSEDSFSWLPEKDRRTRH